MYVCVWIEDRKREREREREREMGEFQCELVSWQCQWSTVRVGTVFTASLISLFCKVSL